MKRLQDTASYRFSILLCFALATLQFPSPVQAKVHEKVLYSFGGLVDGATPSSSLLMDASGNLYGTTAAGGNINNCTSSYGPPGCGVVFELTRARNGEWQESVLYAFLGGTDGIAPSGNLVFDSAGNIYGTTVSGGTGTVCAKGCGTVFELSPSGNGNWTETVVHSFEYGTDGAAPAGLIADASANLYGVTTAGNGVVYKLSRSQSGTWTETSLCASDDANPGLALEGTSRFYFTAVEDYDNGHLLEVRRIGTLWHETDIYDFQGGGNGGGPRSAVVIDKAGNLYGTGDEGGNDYGIAYELKRSAGQWKESMLYNFCSRDNCADGARPWAPLVLDETGNLYGTTTNGGVGCTVGCGVVFRLTHIRTRWKETVLHSFKGQTDGALPTQALTLDAEGNIYGTTPVGGLAGGGGYGTVFELIP